MAIVPHVPVKQPWRIWVNGYNESSGNSHYNNSNTKHHKTVYKFYGTYHTMWNLSGAMCLSLLTRRGESKYAFHDDVIKWNHFLRYWSFCAGNSPVTGEFPSQRPVSRSFDVFFDLRLDKRLCKQSRRRWFVTPSHSLWRRCNVTLQCVSLCSCSQNIHVPSLLFDKLTVDDLFQIEPVLWPWLTTHARSWDELTARWVTSRNIWFANAEWKTIQWSLCAEPHFNMDVRNTTEGR